MSVIRGKKKSDALGSLIKRKMRQSALQNKVSGNDVDGLQMVLGDLESECDLDDLVFESQLQAFEWIKMCMKKKDDNNFSEKFH